jgi:hypothetical protein
MVAMESLDHLLNWKLKIGSHPFPGLDGGTCINEAALMAVGFEYRSISIVEQMPKCFSRPICRLAMLLNDEANDEERQRLLPYVTRLACADTPEVENAREVYINVHMSRCYVRLNQLGVFGLSFNRGLQVLEDALAMGRQADPLGPEEVQFRMDAARAGMRALPGAEEPASSSAQSVVSQAKSSLTMKEMEPMA